MNVGQLGLIHLDPETQTFDDESDVYFSRQPFSIKQKIILNIKPPILEYNFPGAPPGTGTDSIRLDAVLDYQIRGETFQLNQNPFGETEKFKASFRREDLFSHDEFIERFVNPMNTEWNREERLFESNFYRKGYKPVACQALNMTASSMIDVESAYKFLVERPAKELNLHNLSNHLNNRIYQNLKTNLKSKGAGINSTEPEQQPEIEPVYQHQKTLKFIGVNAIPDFVLGYQTRVGAPQNTLGVISVTSIGEVKRPDARIPAVYDLIMGEPMEWNGMSVTAAHYNVDQFGCLESKKAEIIPLKAFQNTFKKLSTEAIYSFARRCVFTDYESIIFVEFKSPLSIISRKRENFVLESVVAAKHYKIKTCETEKARILNAGFHWMTEERWEEDRLFREGLIAHFDPDGRKRGFETRPGSGPVPAGLTSSRESGSSVTSANTTFQSVTSQRFTRGQTSASSEGTSSSHDNLNYSAQHSDTSVSEPEEKPFTLKNRILAEQNKIALRNYIIGDLQVGENFQSQVFVVDEGFLNGVPNVFAPIPSRVGLKVFDPSWIGDNGELLQRSVDMAVRELEAYERLKDLNIMPRVISYGQLFDDTPRDGEYNPKASGPFVVFEELVKSAISKSDIGKEAIDREIKPVFDRMHQAGVVHGDVEFRNMIFEEGGGFKLIDFANCRFSSSVTEHEEEINALYLCFGYRYESLSELSQTS